MDTQKHSMFMLNIRQQYIGLESLKTYNNCCDLINTSVLKEDIKSRHI